MYGFVHTHNHGHDLGFVHGLHLSHRTNSHSCDPTCLPTPWLQFSLPLTVAPCLHHQSDLTKPCHVLAGLVLQQTSADTVVEFVILFSLSFLFVTLCWHCAWLVLLFSLLSLCYCQCCIWHNYLLFSYRGLASLLDLGPKSLLSLLLLQCVVCIGFDCCLLLQQLQPWMTARFGVLGRKALFWG